MAATRFQGALVLAVVLTATGCGDEPDTQPDGGTDADAGTDARAPEPRLVVGTGETAFEPVMDGDEVELHMGIQGGWHVFGGAQVWGVDPEGAELFYALIDPETGEPETLRSTILLAEDRVLWVDDHWERFGDLAIIDGVDTDVLGRTLELTATLEPASGPPLTDARTVVVVAAE